MNGQYTGKGGLLNRGKHYYLELLNECIDELNSKISGNVTIATRAMIIHGLIPDSDGVWKISQLSQDLQKIVVDNLLNCNGLNPYQ